MKNRSVPPSRIGTTRMTPSAPMPALRSHRARTRPAVRSRTSSGSGRSTKSFSVPCPLTNSGADAGVDTALAYGGAGHRLQGAIRQVGAGGIQLDHPGVASEPGSLPADEPPRRLRGRRDRLLDAGRTVQYLEELCVTQGPGGGHAAPQPPPVQPPDLFEQSVVDHPVHPPIQALVEFTRFPIEQQLDRVIGGRTVPGHGGAERAA